MLRHEKDLQGMSLWSESLSGQRHYYHNKAAGLATSRRSLNQTKGRKVMAKKLQRPSARGGVKGRKVAPAPNLVSIEVVLPPATPGLSAFAEEEKVNHTNLEAFRPNPTTHNQATSRLAALGFRVVALSPFSISLEGPPELFQKVFGTQLERRQRQVLDTARPLGPAAFFAPAPGATWEPPLELQGVIEHAYIQPPAIYYESPLPPRVTYHHLRVPGDVALLTRGSEGQRLGFTGRGVKVVMVDTGFYKHPFYIENGYNYNVVLAPDAQDPDNDAEGHGSAEAANVFAVAPDIAFTMVKSGQNSTAAFKKAIDLGPDIITCSWGYDLVDEASPNRKHLTSIPNYLTALELEVARAVANGIVVVFSAGNGHVSFPGMHPDVIAAGGAYFDQQLVMQASDYASAFDSKPYPGRHVPDVCGLVGMQPQAIYIMLPLQAGCQIDKDLAQGGKFPNDDETANNDGWSVISGTSAAAPQLAGVCALLLQKNRLLKPKDVKQALLASARECDRGAANSASNEGVAMPATAGVDGACGHGFVDAQAALNLV
jgi:hypothetical protein